MKRLIILFLIINFNITAYNQVINGTIKDSKTDSTICFATIYLNGTFIGTQSDKYGNFKLDTSQNPALPITISSIGYYTVTVTGYSPNEPLIVYLDPKFYELEDVIVSSKSLVHERKKNLELFKNQFLGISSNGQNCEILNEKDITFNYGSDNDTLKAYASKPLLIYNKALGYRIQYYLDNFIYIKKDETFFYKGNVFFYKDLAVDEKHVKKFKRKRKLAYHGSKMDFFRALWSNDIKSAGFAILTSSHNSLDYNDVVVVTQRDSLSNEIKFLKYPTSIYVAYHGLNNQIELLSIICFTKSNVYFDKDGYFDKSGIFWKGKMSDERVGDMLPYEYKNN
jgi:hypothetical protein